MYALMALFATAYRYYLTAMFVLLVRENVTDARIGSFEQPLPSRSGRVFYAPAAAHMSACVCRRCEPVARLIPRLILRNATPRTGCPTSARTGKDTCDHGASWSLKAVLRRGAPPPHADPLAIAFKAKPNFAFPLPLSPLHLKRLELTKGQDGGDASNPDQRIQEDVQAALSCLEFLGSQDSRIFSAPNALTEAPCRCSSPAQSICPLVQ